MSNMYFSNTIAYNKRQPPIPEKVSISYQGANLLNNFQAADNSKRQVSHTYRATERNYSHPARTSPIMMH